MLQYGVFGGSYLGDTISEFPKSWFIKAKLSNIYDVKLNFFQVRAGLSLKEWKKRGWVMDADPRGWFQWYWRFSMGDEFLQ
mgnify:CR=1 FL=1